MKCLNNSIFKWTVFFLLFITIKTFAQEQSFYIRSLRSIHLENDTALSQKITFKDVDVIYNKIVDFKEGNIRLKESGSYEISSFVNINPGVMGESAKDFIEINVRLIKNFAKVDEEILCSLNHRFTYGNLDVSQSFLLSKASLLLKQDDVIEMVIQILPTSNISINKSKKYDHIDKPTGMEQITGLYIKKR